MVLLGSVEILQGQFLYSQGLVIVLLLLSKYLLDDGQIFWVSIVNASTIACTLVVSLLVETRRVDGFEKHPQQEFKTDHIGIESHEDSFGKARLVGINLLISRMLRVQSA